MLFREPEPYSRPGRPDVMSYEMNFRPRWFTWWICILCFIPSIAVFFFIPLLVTLAFPTTVCILVACLPCISGLCDPFRADFTKDSVVLCYIFRGHAIPYENIIELTHLEPGCCDSCCCCCPPEDFVRLTHGSKGRGKDIILKPACGAERFIADLEGRFGEERRRCLP